MAVDPLWAKAQLDPTYLAGHAGLRNAIIQAILANGDTSSIFAQPAGVDPQTGQPYQSIAQQYGISAQDVSGAAVNPYSTQANLGAQTVTDRGNITNSANAHGLEFSGANAAAQAHETDQANQRAWDASQGLQTTIANIGQQNTGLITGAYQTLMGQAATDPTIPPPPAAPAPAPAAPAPPPVAPSVYGQPGTPSAPASGQWGINPRAPQNQLGIPAKPKLPKVAVGIPHQ